MGYVETYTYIFLNRMGSSNTLIGLTVSVGVPFDIIIQICATALVGKVGHLYSLLIGVFLYSLRTLGMYLNVISLLNDLYNLFYLLIKKK